MSSLDYAARYDWHKHSTELYQWQEFVSEYIAENRHGLLMVVDPCGGVGTTWFSTAYSRHYDDVARLRYMTKKDLKRVEGSDRAVLFDLFKTSRLNYRMIAELASTRLVVIFLKSSYRDSIDRRFVNRYKIGVTTSFVNPTTKKIANKYTYPDSDESESESEYENGRKAENQKIRESEK